MKENKNLTELQKKNILRQSNKEQNMITRECIESALILLMQETDFANISISDIIKRAGVSRSSYYRNYESKEAILNAFLDNIIKKTSRILSQFDALTECVQSWTALLEQTQSLSKEYKLLLDAGFGDTILRRFILSIEQNNPERDPHVRISNIYLSGCIFSVITQWILDDMKTDVQTVASICSGLMLDGIRNKEIRKCSTTCE